MEAIGTLSGGIAHDFNNMLGVIIGNTEIALDNIPEWNHTQNNLQEIKKASLRATDMVRQIMTFSRMEQKLEFKPVIINKIIEEATNFLRSSIPTSIEIKMDVSEDRATVLADPTQINQVLINLCTNAAHAMDEEGGILSISLGNVIIDEKTASLSQDLNPGNYAKLSVSDTGCGINSEVIEKIFDPYFTTKEVGKGTGMGLSVVHGIVKNHKGSISVSSELEKGTTFDVYFPLVEPEEDSTIEIEEEITGGNERILFIDDEGSIVFTWKIILENLGYSVTPITSSTEALELFSSDPDKFDLVITDMTMPGMTGDKLAAKLIEIRPGIPIILATGFSEKIDEGKAKSIGIKAYVLKPVVKRNLAKIIRKVLDA